MTHPASTQFRLTRQYKATLAQAWALWTTEQGIESWWGPEGFSVTVTALDLRPGGTLQYLMTATGAEQVAFMQRAHMALSTPCRVTFTEVTPQTRISFRTLTDFIPGVAPYEAGTTVDLRAIDDTVHVTITCDAMHDATWTERARAGHESQLHKLDALLNGGGRA